MKWTIMWGLAPATIVMLHCSVFLWIIVDYLNTIMEIEGSHQVYIRPYKLDKNDRALL